jgi:hypothetical protein
VQFLEENIQKNNERKDSESHVGSDINVEDYSLQLRVQHKMIAEYWRLYLELLKDNNHFIILSKDSEVLLALTAIKLIKRNKVLLLYLESRYPSSITR